MKRKLKVAFVLIALAMLGIIILQSYWTINDYKVNKEKFDNNINIALRNAMTDCKNEFLDSLRNTFVKHLSPPETVIKIDTLRNYDTVFKPLAIRFTGKYSGAIPTFFTSQAVFNHYSTKIHHRASVPEVVTEMSFYNTGLLSEILALVYFNNIHDANRLDRRILLDKHSFEAFDTTSTPKNTVTTSSGYQELSDYNNSDIIHIKGFLKLELEKQHINSPFSLISSPQNDHQFKPNFRNSETYVYQYKSAQSIFINVYGPVIYLHAVFPKPQYAILKGMLFSLVLSVFLMLFIIYSLFYIARTIINQKKLADLKDDFINNMTHELKTPIATINVALEGLENFNALNDTDKTQRYLKASRNELVRLNNLVTKVLDIAAFERKKIELTIEKLDIRELVNDIIDREKSKTVKILEFNISIDEKVDFVFADKMHFSNVIGNLIDNAIKYSKDPVQVTITGKKQDDKITLSVKDNGIGISSAHIKKIFDKFHRVPSGNIHNVKGTGLGLSYVKYIVKAHGGSIRAKSELNKGSEFIVTLPINHE